jgi:cytidyltransferase-like protein
MQNQISNIGPVIGEMRIVIATGGFDPIHKGHIEYLKSARYLGDALIVGLNSDEWLIRKKGNFFLEWNERASILRELRCVDKVISFDDSDGTSNDAIRIVFEKRHEKDEFIFANGGDRIESLTPEYEKWKNHREVHFVFGVGGFDKKNSSSHILDRWKNG